METMLRGHLERTTQRLKSLPERKMSAGLPVGCNEKESVATDEQDEGRNVLNTSRSPIAPPPPASLLFSSFSGGHQTPGHLSTTKWRNDKIAACRSPLCLDWLNDLDIITSHSTCHSTPSPNISAFIHSVHLWLELAVCFFAITTAGLTFFFSFSWCCQVLLQMSSNTSQLMVFLLQDANRSSCGECGSIIMVPGKDERVTSLWCLTQGLHGFCAGKDMAAPDAACEG